MKKISLLLISIFLILLSGCAKQVETFSPLPEGTKIKNYSSDNGYTVTYPAVYEPSVMSDEIDFVVLDENSGSTVNIQSTDKQANVLPITKEEFSAKLLEEGMEIDILSVAEKTINETPALEVFYKYNENIITQIIYDASDKTYTATYTQLPGTNERVRTELGSIIYSLMS